MLNFYFALPFLIIMSRLYLLTALVLSICFSIIIHESGHLIMSKWLLGGKGLLVHFDNKKFMIAVGYKSYSQKSTKTKEFLHILAGPLNNLIFFCLATLWYPHIVNPELSKSLFISSLVLLAHGAFNIIPNFYKRNDGLKILEILSSKELERTYFKSIDLLSQLTGFILGYILAGRLLSISFIVYGVITTLLVNFIGSAIVSKFSPQAKADKEFDLGNYHTAIKILEALIDENNLKKGDLSTLLKISGCYLALDQYQEAIDYAEKAIVIKSDYAEAYFNRGLARLALNEFEKATDDFKKVLALMPKFKSVVAKHLEVAIGKLKSKGHSIPENFLVELGLEP